MAAVLPFTIGRMEFRDTAGSASALEHASSAWLAQADRGLDKLLGATVEGCNCPDSERTILFGVFVGPQFIGSWALYRTRPIAADPNIVSCLVAPMINLEDSLIPTAGIFPDGSKHPIDEIHLERRLAFYRRTFGIMDWMLDNVMPQDDGTDLDVDEIRFPNAGDGDAEITEWHGGRDMYDQLARKDVDFRLGGRGDLVPLRMRRQNKDVDPDSGRPDLPTERE